MPEGEATMTGKMVRRVPCADVAAVVALAACLLLPGTRWQARAATNISNGADLSPAHHFQGQVDAPGKIKGRHLRWDPPNVDGPLPSVSSLPACPVADVLDKAGLRASGLMADMPNFTAQERIQYQQFDRMGALVDAESGTFDYLALFAPNGDAWTVQETRTPVKGTKTFPASTQDIGLPELVLIFLPVYQQDYDMKCEGATRWNGDAAWVIHFQQRPDQPRETLSFSEGGRVYPLLLKGRAWLAADSGEVLHLDTGTMEAVPMAMRVRNWWLSIDYGPVQFHSRNVTMWLPQTVDAYTEYDDHRTIIYHTFADFMLFSVRTDQQIQNPH